MVNCVVVGEMTVIMEVRKKCGGGGYTVQGGGGGDGTTI